MTRLAVVAMMIVLLATLAPASAQETALDPVPSCTADEYDTISVLVEAFGEDFGVLTDDIASKTRAEIPGLLVDASELQRAWWETVEVMPRCAMGVWANLVIGRTIDEFLIALALIAADDADLAHIHIEAMNEVSEEMSLMSSLIQIAVMD